MPKKRLEFTYNYCKANLASFCLVLIMVFSLNQLDTLIHLSNGLMRYMLMILVVLVGFIFYGYGLVVTKDNIYDGKSLPKLPFFRSFLLGAKSSVIVVVYGTLQYIIYKAVSVIFEVPLIEINEGKIALSNVNTLFHSHGAIDTILFFMFIIISVYIFIFFMEISLARLADKGSLKEALNIMSVGRCIDTIGWSNYAFDYTKLILTIAILAYIQYGLNLVMTSPITNLIIGLLIFIIQYIGIGKIYKTYKDKQYGQRRNGLRRMTL